MKLTKRTVALSYVFVFAVGMIFANSMRSSNLLRGLLWLSVLLAVLSPQLQPTSPRLKKALTAVQLFLCAAAVTLLVLIVRH